MILAYCPLHYGADYLGWSIKSLYDHVDRILILYTSSPSQGYTTNLKNPDTENALKESAYQFGDPSNKIVWSSGTWPHEGAHREAAYAYASHIGADTIVALDADEVWAQDVIEHSLKAARMSPVRTQRIRMLTLWRSFSWHCMDNMWPIRIVMPSKPEGFNNLGLDPEMRVFHFGYARELCQIEYKVTVQGHRGEWRQDWMDKFKNWPSSGNSDLHPVCHNVWNAQPFDKQRLPEFMRSHPFYDRDII